jgi:hypothetical protein
MKAKIYCFKYEGCPQNKVLNEFSQLKTCLLALNNKFLESLGFPLFFDIIAIEINAFLHVVYHLLYAWIVELSRRAAKVAASANLDVSTDGIVVSFPVSCSGPRSRPQWW